MVYYFSEVFLGGFGIGNVIEGSGRGLVKRVRLVRREFFLLRHSKRDS